MEFENDTNYLDQHFLVDKSIINLFVDSAELKPTDNVVEIGPGKCEISDIIAKRSGTLQNLMNGIKNDEKITSLNSKQQADYLRSIESSDKTAKSLSVSGYLLDTK